MEFGKAFLPTEEKTETTSTEQATEQTTTTETENTEQSSETANTGETSTESTQSQALELNDENVLTYLKTKSGKEISAIDELFKDPEVVTKEVNPWAEILDDDDQQYLNFKKETGRSRSEFEALKVDYDKFDAVELAMDRARKDSGMNLTNDEAVAYLEKQLNVDLSDTSSLDKSDVIAIAAYTKAYREERKSEAQKFLTPIERPAKEGEIKLDEYEKFEDGSLVPKSVIEQRAKESRLQYDQFLEVNKKSVDAVAEAKFTITIDENGSKKDLSYTYEYSPEDRQAMLSITNDVSGTMAKTYRDEKGNLDNASFNEDMYWSQRANREKMLASIVHKVRAELIEEIHKRDNNVDFNRNSLHTNGKRPTSVSVDEKKGFGFKMDYTKP